MAEGDVRKVRMKRRSRATGGAVLLPGKTYEVIESDFYDLIRSGKGEDPTGEVKVKIKPDRMSGKDIGKEAPGGEGESNQTLGSSKPDAAAKEKAAKDKGRKL